MGHIVLALQNASLGIFIPLRSDRQWVALPGTPSDDGFGLELPTAGPGARADNPS